LSFSLKEKILAGEIKKNQREFWRGVVPALLEQAAGLGFICPQARILSTLP